ncbi:MULTISPECIES: hypothetical protein [unclassified Methanoregula]|uniref:hypothetical protein n=1 Tax=unclassified Methanoregula TaxID=2649730 RepID=UPI0009C5CB02|nr:MULTISPECIES: hypothetical protein [unclassified Methanoregula]OPX65372.1 MAG: hypothetical protein A4E33_00405 [Methanoregula sp. PtaB.Bin085]OPY32281.1 MAG: hypothetical protein A4E34_02655 [Methanoregula sp. PtaU1.Bin006]
MVTMEKISFETPRPFEPTEIQLDILRTVSGRQGCHIGHVVQALQPSRSESSVRAGVHTLLSKHCLDGGRSTSGIILRLTSRGRLFIQADGAD